MNLMALYNLAEDNNIMVYSFDLENDKALAISLSYGNYNIAINPLKLNTSTDEKMCLAHELGHCLTGSLYNRYSPYDIRGKHERTATKWAIKNLVPRDDLLDAFESGVTESWELADYFDVNEDFLVEAVEYYKAIELY